MPYSARLLLTWVRKQEVDCITNKHKEQEGGRWESPHWQRMWSAQHIWELSENHRPPSCTHTHSLPPQALSQYGQDWWEIAAKQWPPPHPPSLPSVGLGCCRLHASILTTAVTAGAHASHTQTHMFCHPPHTVENVDSLWPLLLPKTKTCSVRTH